MALGVTGPQKWKCSKKEKWKWNNITWDRAVGETAEDCWHSSTRETLDIEPEEPRKSKHIDTNEEFSCEGIKRDDDAPEEGTLAKEPHTEDLPEIVHNADHLLKLVQPLKGVGHLPEAQEGC